MHSRLFSNTAVGALLLGALALTACSSDKTSTGGGGGGGGAADAGPKPGQDAGGGTGGDAGGGPADTGGNTRVDAGPQGPCPQDFPGCRCTPTPDTTDAGPTVGSCADPSNICVQVDDTLAVCLRECETDTDCSGLMVGNPSANRGANICREGVCVEEERQDDEECRFTALGGRPLALCREGANCIRFQDDDPGTGTCLQFCTPTPQDPNGGCTGDLPFCNPEVLSSGGMPIGVCSDIRRPVGARCGGGFSGQCDSSLGDVFCFTNDILDPNDPVFPTLGAEEGFCVEGCTPGMPAQCGNTTDPTLGAGSCNSLGTGMDGPFGLCSHECGAFGDGVITPSTCTSTGSLGAGTSCFSLPALTINSMEGTFGQADICRDVLTPVIPEAVVVNRGQQPRPTAGSMPMDCFGTGQDGEVFRCEAGTACLNIGTQQAPIPACVRLCTASSTSAAGMLAVNECAATTVTSTSPITCIPFTMTSTVFPLGFCAPR
jgi:hypothetical protein